MRRIIDNRSVLCTAIAAGGLAVSAPATAQAGLTDQERNRVSSQQQSTGFVESLIDRAEGDRLRGDCDAMMDALDVAERNLSVLARNGSIPGELARSLQTRIKAVDGAPCPPSTVEEAPQEQPYADPGSPRQPSPDAEDLDAIVDDPNAILGPEGLAPEERRQTGLVERAAEELRLAREAAERCDRSALDDAVARLLAIDGLATSVSPPSSVTPEDRTAIRRSLEEARSLRLRNCPTPPGSRYLAFRALGTYRQYDIPPVGIGFLGDQQEDFAAQSEGDVGMIGGSAIVELPLEGGPLRVRVHYGEGDAANTFSFPAGNQTQFGGVYTAPSPSGTSGVQLQQLGMQGATQLNAQRYGIAVELWLARNSPVVNLPPNGFFLYGEYDRFEHEFTGTIDSSAIFFGTEFFFNQKRTQNLDDNYFGAGIGGRYAYPLSPGVSANIFGSIGGYYRASELHSVEHVTSNVTPPEDRDFTLEINDSDSGFGVRGELGAELEFRVSPTVSFSLGGSGGYRSSVGGVFNPRSSDELLNEGLTTEIRKNDSWSLGGSAAVNLRF